MKRVTVAVPNKNDEESRNGHESREVRRELTMAVVLIQIMFKNFKKLLSTMLNCKYPRSVRTDNKFKHLIFRISSYFLDNICPGWFWWKPSVPKSVETIPAFEDGQEFRAFWKLFRFLLSLDLPKLRTSFYQYQFEIRHASIQYILLILSKLFPTYGSSKTLFQHPIERCVNLNWK